MKTKSIAAIIALALLPIAAFAQPNPPVPPPPATTQWSDRPWKRARTSR